MHQCCTDPSNTCVSGSSLWLSVQQGCQGLVRAPEPHLKLDCEDKPGRTALQGHKARMARRGTLHSAVSKKVCSTPSLSGLKRDFPPKQLHKNGSLLDRRPAASSRSRICLLTQAQRVFYPLLLLKTQGEKAPKRSEKELTFLIPLSWTVMLTTFLWWEILNLHEVQLRPLWLQSLPPALPPIRDHEYRIKGRDYGKTMFLAEWCSWKAFFSSLIYIFSLLKLRGESNSLLNLDPKSSKAWRPGYHI